MASVPIGVSRPLPTPGTAGASPIGVGGTATGGAGLGSTGTLPLTSSTGITTPTGISSGLSLTDGSNTLVGDFSDTYGKGTGTALADTLGNLGTSTDAAVTATNNSILQAAGIQEANLKAGDAAAGLSADSSASALGLGDFESQVSTNLQATDSNMELSEENTLISALQGEGAAHGPDSSFLGTLGQIGGDVLGAVGDVAGVVNDLPGVGTGTASSVLDTLSGL